MGPASCRRLCPPRPGISLDRSVYQEYGTLPVELHNFVEIVRGKEYSFSKCVFVPLLPLAGRTERGLRGSSLAPKGSFL